MGHHRPRLITWTLLIKHNKISIAHLTNLQWMNPTTHDSTTVPDGPSKWVNHKPTTKTGKQLWKKKRKKYINMNENQFTPLQKNPFPKSKCIDIWNTHKQNLRKQNTHNIHKSQNPSPATALPIIIPFPIFTTTATTSTWTQTHHAFNTKQIKTKTHLDCRLINQQEMRQAQEVKKRKRKMKNPKRKADGERKKANSGEGKRRRDQERTCERRRRRSKEYRCWDEVGHVSSLETLHTSLYTNCFLSLSFLGFAVNTHTTKKQTNTQNPNTNTLHPPPPLPSPLNLFSCN